MTGRVNTAVKSETEAMTVRPVLPVSVLSRVTRVGSRMEFVVTQ